MFGWEGDSYEWHDWGLLLVDSTFQKGWTAWDGNGMEWWIYGIETMGSSNGRQSGG